MRKANCNAARLTKLHGDPRKFKEGIVLEGQLVCVLLPILSLTLALHLTSNKPLLSSTLVLKGQLFEFIL